ncbi:MAG: A24 family peptidase [Parvibaculum sp.]|uniref:prepilin peptidase n=1 Tax=Parvibaculum sp. TaxID=2024848 RepID=UPI002848362A|nr:A24 family peptidase [Parvibaculum sp.]MDR3498730.1 A24 family peptidase [Parvibaculum sp.]
MLALAFIDWRHFLLPDALTLPLAAAGLVVAYLLDRPNLVDHLLGVAAGCLFVMLVALIYRRFRGRDGMGQGDAKLLAAAGAWVTWEGLPSVVFVAAMSGLFVASLRSIHGAPLADQQRLDIEGRLQARL